MVLYWEKYIYSSGIAEIIIYTKKQDNYAQNRRKNII